MRGSGFGCCGVLSGDGGAALVTRPVSAGGGLLPPRPSLDVPNHSPTGFAWGYGVLEAAWLALAIRLDRTGDRDTARRLYQRFEVAHVSRWPLATRIPMDDVGRGGGPLN